MKKSIFLLALLCLFVRDAFSQNTNASLQAQLDEAVSTLDLSQVSTHLLADKSNALLDLKVYDGKTLNDSNWVIRPVYEILYAGLQGAAIGAAPPLPPLVDLKDSLDNIAPNAPIPFSLLLFNYERFKPAAVEQNLLSFADGYFYDVPGRLSSPYLCDTLFAATLVQNEASRLHLRFDLRDDYFFSNLEEDIQSLDIDFDDGQGWQTYSTGSIISIPYEEEGLKTIKTRYTLANGQKLLTQTLLHIELPAEDGGFRMFNISPDTTMAIAGDTAFVFYNNDCGDQQIRKPLIILEGYDPEPGTIGLLQFYGLIDEEYDLPSGQTLLEDLHDGGYDLIFVNYDDGADYIQNNAQNVKAIIRKINEMKHAAGSYEQNVLIGVSMGGVVGKWALREMEITPYEDHDTRLFITLDSPLRGANISPALQGLVLSMANVKVGGITPVKNIGNDTPIQEGYASVNSPAAKQMIYYHLANSDNIRGWHDAFYTDFDAMGPLEVEHLALSNGSQMGEGQGYSPSTNLLDKTFKTLDVFALILDKNWRQRLATAGINVLTLSDFRIKLEAWALPGNADREVFKGSYSHTILSFPFFEHYSYTVPENALALDSAPGGARQFNKVNPDNASLNFGWKQHGFCFVPSFSAMDIGEENIDFDLSMPATVVGSGSTPVGAYVGSTEAIFRWSDLQTEDPDNPLNVPRHNQEHAFLNRRLATFMVYQLVGHTELKNLNQLSQGIYNFGAGTPLFNPGNGNSPTAGYTPRSTRSVIDTSLTIRNAGQVWVNRAGRIAYVDSVSNAINTTEPFDLYIRKACVNPSVVTVRSGGKMHLGESGYTATLTIEESNSLWLREGGALIVEDGSTVMVKSGATLVLGQGSLLNVKQGGKILVEPGGEIRIYEGSTINLQDVPSTIHVQGWLTVKGDFDFPGKGFFQFDQGHRLVLEADFLLEGRGKGERFMRLNEGAKLNVGNRKITLRNGAVIYRENSSMELEAGGEASLWYTEFSGRGIGLRAKSAQRVNVRGCDFIGLTDGLILQNMAQANQRITLLLSNFYNCEHGIYAYQCHTLSTNACQFLGGEQGQYGIRAEEVTLLELSQATIDGFSLVNEAGVKLINSGSLNMSGGVIRNCYHGIYCPDYDNQTTSVANISLSGFATLEGNSFGIQIDRGGLIGGSVSMNCARLINNTGAGIAGVDITLNIDACNNAGSTDCSSNVRPNHFEAGVTDPSQNLLGLFFDICYESLPVNTVAARGNFWAWNGHPQANPKMRLGYSGTSGICTKGVTLDDAHAQTEAPVNCSGVIIPNEDDGIGMFSGENTAADREDLSTLNEEIKLSVSPNPSASDFEILVSDASYQVQLVNVDGKTVWRGQGKSRYWVEAEHWPRGIYVIYAYRNGQKSVYKRVVVF